MFYLMFAVLRLLVFMVTSNASTVTRSPASAKAAILEARYNNLLNNGGSFGGDIKVNGNHTVTGLTSTNTQKINGFSLTLNHGTPSVPGGGPLSYSPTYESNQSTCLQAIIDGLSNSGVFQ